MVRGRDALYGHQRRLQLSRYQRSDFAERFAKLRLHASAALAVSRPARVGDIRPATRAASLLTLDYRCRGGLRPTPTRFRRPAPRDSSRLLAYSLVRTRARRQTRAHPGRMPSPTSTAVELISCKKPGSFWRKVLFSQRMA